METKLLGEFNIYINDGNYGNIYPEKELFQTNGIPFISASDFEGRIFNYEGIKYINEDLHFNILKKGQLKINDIVIVVRGNGIGKVGFFQDNIGECNINAQLAFIRTDQEELISLFLYYLLSSNKYLSLLKRYGSGSAQPQLPINRLKLVPITFPNIIIQKKIASFLSTLDSKIELNNRINTELEAMAKTLYDYWFVQFEFPAEALAEEGVPFDFAQGTPVSNGNPYKSSGGKLVWNEALKREIPEGWAVDSLLNLTTLVSRGITPEYIEEGGICILNQKCIRNRTVNYSESRRHNNSAKNSDSKKIELYDILVNSTGVGTLGRVAIVKRLEEKVITVDSHITIVRSNPDKIAKHFFGATLLEKQSEIEKFSLGSTGQVELSRFQLEGIKIILPPMSLQNSFSAFYRPILCKMAICEMENQQLSSLRDWLLPMLMNGQVTVGGKDKKLYEGQEGFRMAAEHGEKYSM